MTEKTGNAKNENHSNIPIGDGDQSCPWHGAKVLLVEDNLPNQQLGMVVLKKFGMDVDVADNGLIAVEALKARHYDMVFMDLQMPVMDGLEATSEIRKPDSGVLNPSIIIVALTANAFSSDKKKCFEVGMDDYISKPFVPETIKKVLEKYLTGRNSNCKTENISGHIDNARSVKVDEGPVDYGNLPVYDHDAFMDRIMHDQKIMAIVLDGFLRDMPQQVQKLKELILYGDCIAAGRQSHLIKGAAANVGGESLRAICLLLEIAGSEGRLDEMKQKISDLEIEFEKLMAVLNDFLKKTNMAKG